MRAIITATHTEVKHNFKFRYSSSGVAAAAKIFILELNVRSRVDGGNNSLYCYLLREIGRAPALVHVVLHRVTDRVFHLLLACGEQQGVGVRF